MEGLADWSLSTVRSSWDSEHRLWLLEKSIIAVKEREFGESYCGWELTPFG